MDRGRKSKEVITQTTRHAILTIVLFVMSVIELWLWKIGHANQYGLYIGLALIFGAILSAGQYIQYRRKA